MANSLYQALGGIQPQAQPAAPAPSAPADSGAGSLFQQLLPQQPQLPGSGPLQMGSMVADNTGLMKGNPFYRGPAEEASVQAHPVASNHPQGPSESHRLDKTATDFFNRMKR